MALLGRRDSPEPADPRAFARRQERLYTRTAGVYAWAVRRLPVWSRWLETTLPHVRGPRVLEVSTGTGYLLAGLAARHRACGVDLSPGMLAATRETLRAEGEVAELARADAAALPFPDDRFDSVVNTMAFSAYPRAQPVLAEMRRVLRPGGRLVLLDVDYPGDGNPLGWLLTGTWKASGDVIRDLGRLLPEAGFRVRAHEEVGGWGSVHLFVAETEPG